MNTKMGCMVAALIGAAVAFADVSVTDVKVQPRSPMTHSTSIPLSRSFI